MGVGIEGHGANAGQQFPEGRVSGEVGSQHQGIDEEADQALVFGPGAPRDRRANDEVILSGIPVKEGEEGGQDGHV